MQAIVADTTPLNYLILIQAIDILPRLYGRVLIPPTVRTELADPLAPGPVREWILEPPVWMEVVRLRNPADSSLGHLDAGERDAIVLASEQQTMLLLMDERDGTEAARRRGLVVVGTLGALDAAAAHGWINLREMFLRLRKTTFRAPARVMNAMLEQDAKRRNVR
jgi:predicted nucleic acid-binding protein